MIGVPGSSSESPSSPPEVECPSCRCVTTLPGGVEGLAVNYAAADVIAGLEDDSSYRSAFSWPNTVQRPGEWMQHRSGHETERRKAPSPGVNRHRRSLSWNGVSLAGMGQHGEPIECEGDGWRATFRAPVSPTPVVASPFHARPEPLKSSSLPRERALSEFAVPGLDSLQREEESEAGAQGRPRAQSERSAAWVDVASQQSVEHVKMMQLAEESLQLAEAMQDIEVAESRKSFIEMKARQNGNAYVAAPVKQSKDRDIEFYLQGEVAVLDHPMLDQEEDDNDTLAARLSPGSQRMSHDSDPLHWGEVSEPPHTGEGSRRGDIIQPGERHPPRRRPNRTRNPCGRNGGECCVGNTGWTNLLHWMGLLSLDIGS